MRTIVTGGAGFIGKHLCDRLVAEGHDVLVIDNLSFGRRSHVPSEAELLELDLGTIEVPEWLSILERFKPTMIYHLAAIHVIPYCMEHPDEAFRCNVTATNTVVSALESYPVEKLVFTSTMDVYDTQDKVHRELDEPRPANIYGLTKHLSETLVRYAAHLERCTSGVVFRLANVYGPNETNPHLIPDAVRKMRAQKDEIVKMGYLGATRDFVFVQDVADALFRASTVSLEGHATYNVGSGTPSKVREVVERVQRLVGDSRPIEEDKKQFRKFDRVSLSPDISKIQKELGWKPSVSLDDGLSRSLDV